MPFEKRVCVLKQVKKGFTADGSALSGAVYCERLGEEITVMPRLLGIAPVREGRYALALWIDGGVYTVDLDGCTNAKLMGPSIRSGVAALLVFLKSGEPEPIAFGSCGTAPTAYEPILAEITARERKKKAPMPVTNTEDADMGMPDALDMPTGNAPFRELYDDEAIAEENFYGERAVHGDGAAEAEGEAAGGMEEAGDAACGDEESVHPFRVAAGGLTYYRSVQTKLREAFARFERDTRLTAVFPCSEWVKAEGALLGVIYEGGLPRYLCVAVEANGDPPEEMKEHCTFVPEGPFSDMVGFYVVFQSADTGEYVTVSSN